MARGILLIEDEEVLAKNIKRYLERHGYDTLVAGTAAEGISTFRSVRSRSGVAGFEFCLICMV